MRRIAALLIAALSLAACSFGQPQPVTLQQTVDGLSVTLEVPPEVVVLRDYQLIVTLRDAQGAAVDGATVYLDQQMPGMAMGSNQPIAEPLGGGRYRVSTVYSMEGSWQVVVHAKVAGTEHQARFDLPVTLPK